MAFVLMCTDKTGLSDYEIALFDGMQHDSFLAYAGMPNEREPARMRILLAAAKVLENAQLPSSWRRTAIETIQLFTKPP